MGACTIGVIAPELLLELGVFLLERLDETCVISDVIIDCKEVPRDSRLDVLRSISEVERVVGILKATLRRTDVRDHHSATVPAEGVLEESRELAASILHELIDLLLLLAGCRFTQSFDAVAEHEQTLVDLRAFYQPNASVIRGGSTLAASEVHETQFGVLYLLLNPTCSFFHLQEDL